MQKVKLFQVLNSAAGAMLLVTVGYLLVQNTSLGGRVEDTQSNIADSDKKASVALQNSETASKDAAKAVSAVKEANRRLAAAGKPTVPVPVITPPVPVPAAVHQDEFTAEEAAAVQVLITEALRSYRPALAPSEILQIARSAAALVPKPADGKTPTAAQLQPLVNVGVAAYCTEDRCVGKVGPAGRDGVDGKDAPKITDEQLKTLIEQSFASYCSQDSRPCDGKVGPTGPEGPKGAGGRSIVDQDCVGVGDDSKWVFYYDQAPVKVEVNGPCRVEATP